MSISTPNFRDLLPLESDYVDFNREERQFAAILYHLLLHPGGVERFLALVGAPMPSAGEPQVYFEYTHLRDRFSASARRCPGDDQRQRLRDALLRMLPLTDSLSWLWSAAPREFNEFFCGRAGASGNYYQMPARWSPKSRFDHWHAHDAEFARQACKMAWAFNIKPDLVIHTAEEAVVCVELKVESDASSYRVPSSHYDDGYYRSSQLAIQHHALHKLLGYQTHLVLLSPSQKRPTQQDALDKDERLCQLTWKEVLQGFPTYRERPFVQRLLASEFLQAPSCR